MTTLCNIAWIVFWTVTVLIAWLIVAVVVGVITGRAIRRRDHHYPSPNHPAVRARKQHVTERPLTPEEATTIAELDKQFAPDTQESQ